MTRPRTIYISLAAFGILNAVLYCSLLPLWEGFDEPFHYGYVQHLSVHRTFPVLGRTQLSDEIRASLQLAPASHIVRKNIPVAMTFSEYFRLEPAERASRRARLNSLDPDLRKTFAAGPLNYEAQQAPLAYLPLALPDRLWAALPLPERIWRLRLLCGIASSLAMMALTLRLSRGLGVPPPFQPLVLFALLSSQMLSASTAHVSNDWLSIPLAVLFLVSGITLCERSDRPAAVKFALVLCAGLLTKAYFLAFVPIAFGLIVWLRWKRRITWRTTALFSLLVLVVSGPWYLRNLSLYGNIAGMQESVGRYGLRDVWSGLAGLPWPYAVTTLARKSLWTGNNSDLAFSSSTVTLMWAILLMGLVLFAAVAFRTGLRAAEVFVVGASFAFVASLFYSAAVGFVFTQGVLRSPSPWYAQPLLAPLLCFVFAGFSRAGRTGRILAALMVCLWGYVLLVTYWAKLIPLYGGWDQGPARLVKLIPWYTARGSAMVEMLSATALGNPQVVFVLAAIVGAAALGIPAALGWMLWSRGRGTQPQPAEISLP